MAKGTDDSLFLTRAETARLLRMGVTALDERIRSGEIPGVLRLGRRVLIARRAVEGLVHDAPLPRTTDAM